MEMQKREEFTQISLFNVKKMPQMTGREHRHCDFFLTQLVFVSKGWKFTLLIIIFLLKYMLSTYSCLISK